MENVKTQLAEIKTINLSHSEVKALKELKNNPAISLKKKKQQKTNKKKTKRNKADKIFEAKVHLYNRKHYELLKAPMVKTT